MRRQKWCRECLILHHITQQLGFKWGLPSIPTVHSKFSYWGEQCSSATCRSEATWPPSPFLLWLSHSKSICNKLISLGALQPPWPHTGCAFSICCLSSQVHGMLSASCHSSYNFRLSKAFYNWIQDGESRKKPTCYFSYIAQMEDWTWLFLQEKLGTKLQRTHIPSKDVALYPPKELGWSSPTVKHCLIEHTCLYYFKSKVGCKQFQCFDSHRAAAVSSEGATVLKQHTRSAVVWILLLF